MDNLIKRIKNINAVNFIFYIVTLTALVFKSFIFHGFIMNKNPYILNFSSGYSESISFVRFYIGFVLIFLSFCFLFKNYGRRLYLLIANVIITFILLMDLWYFRGFFTLPSITIMGQTANLENLSDSIFSIMSSYDFIMIIDIIILLVVFAFTFKERKSERRNIPMFAATLIIPTLLIGYIPFASNVLKKPVKFDYIFGNYDPTQTSQFLSPLGYHVLDIYTVYKDSKPYDITEEERQDIDSWLSNKLENLPDNNYKSLFKGKNLLIIQVESLENFVINETVEGQEITPNLNRLLKNSIYFPNIYDQVNEGNSSDSDLMINTSIFPIRKGSTFFRYPNTSYNSLPNLLEEMGYSSTSIHPDKGSYWNYALGLKGVGFDNFIDYYHFNDTETIGVGMSDGTFLPQVAEKIKELKKPFYAHTVTLTSHGPFEIPEKYKELKFNGELNNNIMGDYFQSLRYTDKHIGNLLNSLEEWGILEDTVVVITGDHRGVHKYYPDKLAELKNPKESWLDDENQTLPLIIYNKSISTGIKNDVVGGQVDIMPTLAYLMGIEKDKYKNTVMGRNLLNTNKSYAVTNNGIVLGKQLPQEEASELQKAIQISDLIIKSNYFKQ